MLLLAACRPSVAETVLAHAKLVPPSTQLQADVARFARVGMQANVVFNRLPSHKDIAVLLVDPTTDWTKLATHNTLTLNVKDNCYTSAQGRTVVCDAGVFVARPDAILGMPATKAQRTAFARWILGHELGHIATATTGFHSDPMADASRARDLAQQRREYAADCWMVETFDRAAPHSEQIAFEQFAIDAINEHFRVAEPNRPPGVGLLFDYTSADPYDFRAGGTHPDAMLRSIRLLHIAAETRHDAMLRSFMSPLVRKLVPDPLWTGRGPCGLS